MKDDINQIPISTDVQNPDSRQSWWGFISVGFSITAIVSAIIGLILNAQFGVHGDVPPLWAIVSVGACVFSLLMSVITGIVGILQNRRRREVAYVGMAISGLFFLIIVLWTGLGR
jgi:hypothetical protein